MEVGLKLTEKKKAKVKVKPKPKLTPSEKEVPWRPDMAQIHRAMLRKEPERKKEPKSKPRRRKKRG